MKRITTLLVLLISFLAVQPLFSNAPNKSVCHPAYGENVNDLCLTGDQLWLATAGGLVRFNTVTGTFACFNKSNAGLPVNMVNFISPYADGQLAYLTPKGIGIFRDTITSGTLIHSTDSIWKIAGMKTDMDFFNGTLYVGILNRLLLYDQTSWKTLNVLPPYYSSLDLISDFEQGPDGNVYFSRQRGVSMISGDSLVSVVTLMRRISELAFTADAMWMATPYGLYYKKDTMIQVLTKLTLALPADNILRLKKSIDGKLWLLTPKGLTLFNPADASFVTYTNDSLNFGAKPLMTVDLLGNVWLVGQKPGRIWKFDGLAWTHFNFNKGLKSNHVGDFVIHGKHVWIGGSDSTLTNYDGNGSCVYDSAGISVLKHKRPIFLKGKRIVFFADSDVVVDSYDTIRALIKTGFVNKLAKAAYDSAHATY
jgi:ligand-binding sensor domain-containing protein